MLFNSLIFVGFFLCVYALYSATRRNLRVQNVLLLVASYVFYGYWDWRFLSLIAISTLTDYVIGRHLGATEDTTEPGRARRKRLLIYSIVVNLSILGFFKYFDFFAENFAGLLSLVGMHADPITLRIILPVGISFYTFQTMSYTFDVYRKKMAPTDSLLNFAVFVAFFPQLVAGPIERAQHLLPQVEKKRRITTEMIDSGLFLVLWGYFKKVVVADNCGVLANDLFNHYHDFTGVDILVGVLAFAAQIYCDFSGYSDIARGTARLMGFDLMVNFRLPYFALNPSDFWSRWHISLSSWLREYLYFPLGGNRKGPMKTYRNLAITMLLGGLWHGAAWNFVAWGAFHGVILILYRLFEKRPIHADPWNGENPRALVFGKMALMFLLTLIGWVLFRSGSLEQIAYLLTHVWIPPMADGYEELDGTTSLFFFAPVVLMESWQYVKRDLLIVTKQTTLLRVALYTYLFLSILLFGSRESMEFVYFQF
jgi:alginate O-acetyltransferase complex protein AlgI